MSGDTKCYNLLLLTNYNILLTHEIKNIQIRMQIFMNLNKKLTITFLDVLVVLFPTQKGIHGLVMELIILNKIWHF